MTERIQSAQNTLSQARHLSTDPVSGFAEAVPIPMVLLASDTRIRYANTAFVQTLGIENEHYQHRKFPGHWLISPQEGISQLRKLLYRAGQSTAHPEPVCLPLRSSDGSEIPTDVYARPLPSIEQGPASLIVLTFRKLDPPEARQQVPQSRENHSTEHLQDELKHSEERLRILFEYAPDGYFLNDLKGNLVDGNKAAEAMVGYERQELIGKNFLKLNLLPKSQIPKAVRSLLKNAVGQPTGPDEFTLRRKDGSTVPVEIRTYPVRIGGRVLILGIARDITERQKAQHALEQLNENLQKSVHELERSNRELADFAHVTAHDLKTPLRGIGTLVEWLDQDHGEQIGPEGRENLHLLRGRVDRMGHLINGILRYSQIGHGNPSVEILDTHALVQEAIEQIAPPEHIEIQIENTLGPVSAERTRLTQVFQNLISNAVKYIDKPQGRIRISARTEGDFWEFCVADNGPGIEAKHFEKIFKMFQTLSAGDPSHSTGLGLAVVKKIVDMAGGRVWLESEIGHGSTFFFTLPKHHKGATQART